MEKLDYRLRLATIGTILLCGSVSVFAKPAIRESKAITQPDGTTVTIRLVGDEHAHLYLTEDENPVNREQSVESKGYGLCETSFPSTGEQKGLVILVEYQDVRFDSRNSSSYKYTNYTSEENAAHTYWTDLLNKPGFDGFGSNGSCRDWFLANSADSEGNSRACFFPI